MALKNSDGPEVPEWIVTFSDIISLLVTFFVLLLTYSSLEADKVKLIRQGYLKGYRGMLDPNPNKEFPSLESRSTSFIKVPKKNKAELPGKETEVDSKYHAKKTKNPLDIEETERKTCFKIKTKIFFKPGATELPLEARPILRSVAHVLHHSSNNITIKGYANIGNTIQFLESAKRAGERSKTIWKYFVHEQKIDPKRITIAAINTNISNLSDPIERKKARTIEIIFWNITPEISFSGE